MKIKKILLSLLLVIPFLFLNGFTTLAESETIDGETYFNDYFNYEWDFYKFDLTADDINRIATYTNFYYFRIDVKLPDNALIDGTNTPLAIYSFNGYKLKYGNIIQTAQRYNIHEVEPGNVVVVNITINKRSVDDYVEANIVDPQDQLEYWTVTANYINEYFVAYYAKTDTYETGYNDGRDDGFNDGYDVGYNDGYNYGHQNGRDVGYNEGYNDGYNAGKDDGYNDGYNEGYDNGYNAGYNDGYNDFNVADYFGTNNIAKAPDIDYGTASDPFEPSTAIILINKGYGAPNILLDKQYLIVIIKKNIYNHVVVLFDDYSPIYHYEAIYHDIGDHDIYVFDLSDRINSKYELEIRKENVTTSEQLNQFLNDVKDNLYFSHASKLLNSSIATQLYYFGYLIGLEETLLDNEAYNIGYETGYNRGYTDGNEAGYEQGFDDGYEQGFDYGKTTEYEHGYKDGYKQGSNDAFLNDVSKWFGPMVLIVLIAGAYVATKNRRSDD